LKSRSIRTDITAPLLPSPQRFALECYDAASIAWQLMHMDDQAKLLKISQFIRDHLKHPDRTNTERQIALGRIGMEGADGRRLSPTAAIARLRNPEPVPDHSYGVHVVATDGRLWGNGVRLRTQEEAQIYADVHVAETFEGYVTEDKFESCVTASVVRFDERPLNSIIKRRGKFSLTFTHGTCGSLNWRPLHVPEEGYGVDTVGGVL
jgi:hypothetical protein